MTIGGARENEAHARPRPTAVLLDQHPLWLDGLEHALARLEVTVVGRATDPDSAIALVGEREPNLFVVSSDLADPLDCLRRAHGKAPELRSIVFVNGEQPGFAEEARAAGAAVCIPKSAGSEEIASALATVHVGNVAATPENGALLTRREQEILELVARGQTNAQIAKALWVTQWTVKFHLANAFRKLGVTNRTEAARYVFEHGLAEVGPLGRESARSD